MSRVLRRDRSLQRRRSIHPRGGGWPTSGSVRGERSRSSTHVVTHRPAETIIRKGGTSYVFITDGIPAALESARQAAGSEDVLVSGGADIAQQFLNAGPVDEVLSAPVLERTYGCAWRSVEGVWIPD